MRRSRRRQAGSRPWPRAAWRFPCPDDAIDVEAVVIDALVAFVIGVELFAFLASGHGGIPLGVVQPFGAENKSIRARMQWCRFTFLGCRFTFPSSNERIHLENRQQHRQYYDTDRHSHCQNQQRLHQPHQAGQTGAELALIGDTGLYQHHFQISALLSDTRQMHQKRGEKRTLLQASGQGSSLSNRAVASETASRIGGVGDNFSGNAVLEHRMAALAVRMQGRVNVPC
jgi:hypothetical protein